MPNETMPSQSAMADFIAKASETTETVEAALARGETVKIVEAGVEREATGPDALLPPKSDRETFAKMSAFFDTGGVGPVFQSLPICGRIFFCRVLSLGENLAAQASADQLAQAGKNSEDFIALVRTLATLSVACLGYIDENDIAALTTVRANLGNPKKWPALAPHLLFESRNPMMLDTIAVPLMSAYLEWLSIVLPTEQALSNSSAPAASSAASS